jgi:hypothetical protein
MLFFFFNLDLFGKSAEDLYLQVLSVAQALFYSTLQCSQEMLVVNDGSKNLIRAINNKFSALSFHSREYYLVDMNEEDK